MVSAFGNLNGPGPQQVWVNMTLQSQSASGNTTTFAYQIRYYGNGYGSWSGTNWYWSANIAGVYREGSFNISSGEAYDTYTQIASGTVTVSNASDGTMSDRRATATIATDHTSVGDGTATTSYIDIPRIPKAPSAPGAVTVSGIGAKEATFSWTAPTNNGGDAVNKYLLQINVGTTTTGAVHALVTLGNVRTYKRTDLDPAQAYNVRVRAGNDSYDEWSNYSSPTTQFKTISGAYVGKNGSYVPCEVLVGKGSNPGSYVPALVYIGKGSNPGSYVLAG